jgi:adenylate cyclase
MSDAEPFDDAGLLEGLSGSARAERAELLQYLRDRYGLSDETLQASTENGTIVLAAAGREVGIAELYSARDIARESGLPFETWLDLVRASALPAPIDPDTVYYGETHLAAARSIQQFIQAGIHPEQMLGIARVLGRGLAQAADQMRQTVMELTIAPGMTETALAQTYAATSEGLAPMLGPLVEQMLRLHLHNAVRDEIVTEAERHAGELPGARDVSVAFADLVGFTKLGEQLPPGELEAVADRLVTLTAEIISTPVRLVKSVGDAVLLVSSDPIALAETAFRILERVEAQGRDFPQVRIGLAYGPAVTRAGDWFGRPVNLASRITGVARAGSVVADRAFHDTIGDGHGVAWSSVGERRLKGIGSPVRLFRARPPKPR